MTEKRLTQIILFITAAILWAVFLGMFASLPNS
jgi:hypothetical protein